MDPEHSLTQGSNFDSIRTRAGELSLIGQRYGSKGLYEAAIYFFRRELEEIKKQDVILLRLPATSNLSQLLAATGQLKEAKEVLEETINAYGEDTVEEYDYPKFVGLYS
jgi:tetratricopeptide (TPR) repeat protein